MSNLKHAQLRKVQQLLEYDWHRAIRNSDTEYADALAYVYQLVDAEHETIDDNEWDQPEKTNE